MKLKNGVDILRIARLEHSANNPRFLSRVYGTQELALHQERGAQISFLAGNFSAKEAFSKALGTGVRGFSLPEVEVLRTPLGEPYFFFSGKAKQLVEESGLRFSVSISHEKEYAIAFVTAWSAPETS